MTAEIPLVPEVPEAVREAAQVGRLIPFVGAGLSRLAGCPSWDEFANAVLASLVKHGRFTYAQLDQVKSLNPRVKLSIAMTLHKQTETSPDFRGLLHPQPRGASANGRRLYSCLSRLGKTFVTTNYDEWLDDVLPSTPAHIPEPDDPPATPTFNPRTVFHKTEDLLPANLNRDEDVVIHLHGSVKDPEGMVLTTRDYLQHYANDRRTAAADPENNTLTFLEHLFTHKTVLFIGYGLEELEILEYTIIKAGSTQRAGLQPRHFLLQGFYSHELELMVNMRIYYRGFGIELLPFSRDQSDWDQLITVLESFSLSAPASTPAVLQDFREMEAMLDG